MRTTEERMSGEVNDTLLPSTVDDIKRLFVIPKYIASLKERNFDNIEVKLKRTMIKFTQLKAALQPQINLK